MTLLGNTFEHICTEAAGDMLDAATYPRSYTQVRTQLQYGEETITERLLLDLTRRLSRPGRRLALRVISIAHDKSRGSQYAEPKSGADWEWLFGSREKKWFKLRVQAKCAKSPPGAWGYNAIGKLRSNGKSYQIDDLIRDAGRDYWPIYAFYDSRFLTGGTLGYCKACPRTDRVFRGVTYADARSIRKLKAANALDLDSVRRVAAPMPCLVDCRTFVGVRSFALRLVQDSEIRLRESGLGDSDSIVPELSPNVPSYVREIVERAFVGGAGPLILNSQELAARHGLSVDDDGENSISRLGGIVVISDGGED